MQARGAWFVWVLLGCSGRPATTPDSSSGCNWKPKAQLHQCDYRAHVVRVGARRPIRFQIHDGLPEVEPARRLPCDDEKREARCGVRTFGIAALSSTVFMNARGWP